MNKFFQRIVIYTVLAGLMTIPVSVKAESAIETAGVGEAAAVLSGLGISGTELTASDAEQIITRKAFINEVLKISGIDISSVEGKGAVFTDVSSSDASYGAISAAAALGLISGQSDGTFGPNEPITYIQAIKITSGVLGYDVVARAMGGYPDGYMNAAVRYDLTKGIKADMNENMTKGMAALLIYNALQAPVMKAAGIGDGTDYKVSEDRTLLSDRLHINKIEGLVTATPITSLTGDFTLNDGYIAIEDKGYKIGNTEADKYLGYQVVAYTKEDDNHEQVIQYIMPKKGRNDFITVNADNISKEDTKKDLLVYWNNKDTDTKPQKADISPAADMIYNGKAFPAFKAEDLMPMTGKVELLDNDNDGTADVVFVSSYEIVAVDSVSLNNKTIYSKYHADGTLESVDLDGMDYEITKNNRPIALEEIQPWDILAVALSKPGTDEYISIVVTTSSVSGTVSEKDEVKGSITIDGTLYKFSEFYKELLSHGEDNAKDIQVGDSAKFYFDLDGKISAIDKTVVRSKRYGYLFTLSKTKGIENTFKLRLLDDEEVWQVYPLASKVKYNGESAMKTSMEMGEILSVDQAFTVKRQVVSYKLNKENEISEINTAQVQASGSDVDEGLWYTDETLPYRQNNKSFDSKTYLKNDAVVFVIPERAEDLNDEKKYIVDSAGYFIGDKSYTYKAYDKDEYSYTSVISVASNLPLIELVKTNYFFVVDKCTSTIVTDDSIQKLYGVAAGQKNLSVNGESTTIFNGVNQGDILQIHIDSTGRVDDYLKAFDISLGRQYSKATLMHDKRVLIYGDVKKSDPSGKRIQVNDGLETYKTLDLSSKNLFVTLYDQHAKKVSTASINDIEAGDYIVARIVDSGVAEVVIIRFGGGK